MKGYIGPKMKYIRKIGSEIFNVFIYGAEGVNVPRMVAILDLFKNFIKDIYCPMKGYIRATNEVYQQNRVRDI